MPTKRRPVFSAATAVVPEPTQISAITSPWRIRYSHRAASFYMGCTVVVTVGNASTFHGKRRPSATPLVRS